MLTVDRRLVQHFDWTLLGLMVLLLLMGLVNLHSASNVSVGFSDELRRQLMSLGVGAGLAALGQGPRPGGCGHACYQCMPCS